MRLDALEHGLPALGYVVSYRALQAALDAALGRVGNKVIFGAKVTAIRTTPSYAAVETIQVGTGLEISARLVAVADGGGELIGGLKRHHHDYGQVAVVGKLASPPCGVDRERHYLGFNAFPRQHGRRRCNFLTPDDNRGGRAQAMSHQRPIDREKRSPPIYVCMICNYHRRVAT